MAATHDRGWVGRGRPIYVGGPERAILVNTITMQPTSKRIGYDRACGGVSRVLEGGCLKVCHFWCLVQTRFGFGTFASGGSGGP